MTVAAKLLDRADVLEAQHEAGFRDIHGNVPEELRRIAKELTGPKALQGG
jgi:hypothetical protein